MTHLRIELNTITENVTSNVIHKLYETAKAIIDAEEANDVQESLVSLKGNLLVSKAYGDEIDWLETKFPDLHITAGARYIRFADSVVENICVTNWGDGTGCTEDDLYAVNTFSGSVFGGNTSITTFNELRYFKPTVFNQGNLFKGCSSLTEVTLSSGTTAIRQDMFTNCSNLTTIRNTESITEILGLANCSKLVSINTPNLTNVGNYGCSGCTLLSTIDTSNVTSIGHSSFLNCTSLTSVDLSSCTSIGNKAFSGCTSLGTGLTLELNLTGLTSYPYDAFYNTKYSRLILHSPLLTSEYDPRYPLYELMSNLTYLDLSDFLVGTNEFDKTNTKYYEGSFYGNTSLVTFIYPLNVNSLETSLKYGKTVSTYRYAIILNTTPPSLDISDSNNPPSEWFTNSNLHIYVPDSAKAAYLADSDWASISGNNGSVTISDRLHGLSELPAGVWTTGLASQYLTPAQLATS